MNNEQKPQPAPQGLRERAKKYFEMPTGGGWPKYNSSYGIDFCLDAMLQFASEQTEPLKQRIKELESAVFHSERFRMEDAAEHQDDEIRLRQRIAELEAQKNDLAWRVKVWESNNDDRINLLQRIAELEQEVEALKQEIDDCDNIIKGL